MALSFLAFLWELTPSSTDTFESNQMEKIWHSTLCELPILAQCRSRSTYSFATPVSMSVVCQCASAQFMLPGSWCGTSIDSTIPHAMAAKPWSVFLCFSGGGYLKMLLSMLMNRINLAFLFQFSKGGLWCLKTTCRQRMLLVPQFISFS